MCAITSSGWRSRTTANRAHGASWPGQPGHDGIWLMHGPITLLSSWPGLSRPSTKGILGFMRHAWGWSAFVYIMTNRPNGILYVGVTNDIARRAWEHREGVVDGFTKRYGLKRPCLVRAARVDRCRDPAREEHETLAASVESPPDTGDESRVERPLRHVGLKTWMAGTSPAMTSRDDGRRAQSATGRPIPTPATFPPPSPYNRPSARCGRS
jgi:predicted GIY-YIG superfamily endonuclease